MQIGSEIYNHLSVGLTPKKRNTTHKSSTLKEVYTNMARYNKQSPLFMLSLSDTKQSHMINIKEAAITLQDVAESFADATSTVYDKKLLRSDNSDIVSGAFRTNRHADLPNELHIQISELASEQSNVGRYVNQYNHDLPAGRYTFELQTETSSSRFSFNVSGADNNSDIFHAIAKSVNSRDLDVTASVLQEGNNVAFMLSSVNTGIPDTVNGLYFTVDDLTENGFVNTFRLDEVSTQPANSVFSINGEAHASTSNHISINQAIELDFHKTASEPVIIRFIPDTAIAKEQAEQFIDAYNGLVDLSATSTDTHVGSRNLYHDISRIALNHKDALERIGISVDGDGHLIKDEPLFSASVEDGSFAALFSNAYNFKDDIANASKRLSLDPVAYVNKIMVSYPNTGSKAGNSYTQSVYSGMMYNNYA